MRTPVDNRFGAGHAVRVKHELRIGRVAILLAALALIAAPVLHASHGHDSDAHGSQWHATCVVCQLGAPVAAQPAALHVEADAPVCHLSIADRDHAIPPARVDVDLSRAPPALLAS